MLENLHFTSTGILKKGAEEEETLLWHMLKMRKAAIGLKSLKKVKK